MIFFLNHFKLNLKETRNPTKIRPLHCVECIQLPSFFWSVFSCIWTEYKKIRARKISIFGRFSRSAKFEESDASKILEKLRGCFSETEDSWFEG